MYFDRLLLLKVYKVSAKKSMGELYLMIPKSGAKFEENLFFVSRMTRIRQIFIRKLSKLVFSWDPFVQSRKSMSYRLTEEL